MIGLKKKVVVGWWWFFVENNYSIRQCNIFAEGACHSWPMHLQEACRNCEQHGRPKTKAIATRHKQATKRIPSFLLRKPNRKHARL